MKSYTIIASALFTALVFGCAEPPDLELKAAKASLDSALAVQADKYAAVDYKAAKDSLDSATAEIEKQNVASPLKQNYDKAKALLASATAAANIAKAKAVEGKKQAAADADAALTNANTLLAKVKGLVEKAPKGKPDTETMKAEVVNIETSLGEAQSSNGGGDYFAARDKANICVAKLDSLKNAIAAASAKKPQK